MIVNDNAIIFHIDVNSAYLSWSALRELQNGSTQDLRTIPSIVGGDQETRHGIVVENPFRQKYLASRQQKPLPVHFKNVRHL